MIYNCYDNEINAQEKSLDFFLPLHINESAFLIITLNNYSFKYSFRNREFLLLA